MKMQNKIKAVKEVKSYGNLTLNSSDLPMVKDLKLGDKQKLIIEVDITSLRKPDRWEISEGNMKPNDIMANVKILKVSSEQEMKKMHKKMGGGMKSKMGEGMDDED